MQILKMILKKLMILKYHQNIVVILWNINNQFYNSKLFLLHSVSDFVSTDSLCKNKF